MRNQTKNKMVKWWGSSAMCVLGFARVSLKCLRWGHRERQVDVLAMEVEYVCRCVRDCCTFIQWKEGCWKVRDRVFRAEGMWYNMWLVPYQIHPSNGNYLTYFSTSVTIALTCGCMVLLFPVLCFLELNKIVWISELNVTTLENKSGSSVVKNTHTRMGCFPPQMIFASYSQTSVGSSCQNAPKQAF